LRLGLVAIGVTLPFPFGETPLGKGIRKGETPQKLGFDSLGESYQKT